MEALVSGGVADTLISSLDFSHEGVARYILSSRHCLFPAESGNRWDSTSSRVLRFRIADASVLETASCRVAFSLVNETQNATPAAVALTPVAPCGSIFRRCRTFIGGALCEDITDFGRTVVLYDKLKPLARRENDSIQGFPLNADGTYEAIPASAAKRCICELPVGLLSQHKWLPMAMVPGGGIVVELELDDANSCFTEAAAKWHLEECNLFCTMHEVDTSMLNSLYDVFREGTPINIPFDGLSNSKHIVTSSTFTINISRAFTRLKSVLVTLFKAGNGRKPINSFYHPLLEKGNNGVATVAADELKYQCQIASHKYPERSVKGVGEAFMRLRQSNACFYGNDDIGIKADDFRKESFIATIDFERAGAQAFHTGISTRNGQMLTLTFEDTDLGANGDFVVVTLCYDGFVRLSGAGVEILE